MAPIRILIADDHALLRAALRVIIEREVDLQVVGEAADGREAIELAESTASQIVVIDLIMPEMDGLTALAHLGRLSNPPTSIVLSGLCDASTVRAAFAAGARGYLSKNSTPAELITAIRAAARGQAYLSVPLDGQSMDDFLAETSCIGDSGPLSPRERQVLRQVALGYTAKEIASGLGLRAKTVEGYRARALCKLGLRSRADVVRYALAVGLLTLSPANITPAPF